MIGLQASLILILFSYTVGQSNMEKGLEWYEKRAEGSKGFEAKSIPIDRSIEFFEKSLQEDEDINAALMLMKALYYKGEYTTNNREEKKKIFDKGKKLGEEKVIQFPESASFRYWYLVNLGSWSKVYGIIRAAKEGVADLMKEHSEFIINLDPRYESGGGYFMLGAIHFQSPYIPFFLSWPDNDEAIIWLQKAVETGNRRPVQLIYLAKALHKNGMKKEAIEFLEEVSNLKPLDGYIVEYREKISEAKVLLEEYR